MKTNYRERDGCWNCPFSYDDGDDAPWLFCAQDRQPKPLVEMVEREGFHISYFGSSPVPPSRYISKDYSKIQAWADALRGEGKTRHVEPHGICDEWEKGGKDA